MITKRNALLLSAFLCAAPCHGEEPKPVEDIPRAVISDVATTSSGGVLFACRVFASRSKILYLHGEFVKPAADKASNPRDRDAVPLPFSLNGSTLTDLATGKVYANLPSIPREPYFGPMEILTSISPGGWIQLGVAFPPLPPPPLDKDGKPLPYQLRFEIPKLKISSVVKLDPGSLKPISGFR